MGRAPISSSPLLLGVGEMLSGDRTTAVRQHVSFSFFSSRAGNMENHQPHQCLASSRNFFFFLPKTCFTGGNEAVSDGFTLKQNTGFYALCVC